MVGKSRPAGGWAGLSVLLALVLAAPAWCADPGRTAVDGPAAGIFVFGQGEVSAPVDVAYLSLAVEIQARTTTEAQRENARLTTAVIQRLVGVGIPVEKIKSAGFALYPVTSIDPKSGKPRSDGYQVTNRLSVTVTDLSRVGPAVDAAIAAGATNVSDVQFTAEDLGKVQVEALRRAAANARERAQTIAEALGLKLGPAVSVTDETSTAGPPVLYRMKAAGEAAATPFLPGEARVQARVTVQFSLL